MGAAALVWRRGQKDGDSDTRFVKLDEELTRIDREVAEIRNRNDLLREQFGDLKANMATRNDVAALNESMRQMFGALQSRLDSFFHAKI